MTELHTWLRCAGVRKEVQTILQPPTPQKYYKNCKTCMRTRRFYSHKFVVCYYNYQLESHHCTSIYYAMGLTFYN
jgi:hypothetical protein